MSDFPRNFPQFTSCWKEHVNKIEIGETTSSKIKFNIDHIFASSGASHVGEEVDPHPRRGRAWRLGEEIFVA
jgi:hypothetical protein